MFTIQTYSPQETIALAKRFAAYLNPGTIIALSGELGAGKTVFAKGVAIGLGINEHITSPTFTIINEYDGEIPFYHMDTYRLSDESEALDIGVDEYFNYSGIVLVEWPEQIETLLPAECIRVNIKKGWQDDGREYRIIEFTAKGHKLEKLMGEFVENEIAGN
ncbi:MAG: tRNA (adenosine(37)-N6)-threonylcarbamoyltransferase complex ATPase subunit type 1 TsaE [Desulfitobacteriaceae bacterium]|nr:tRNA (adenosine(37)-N6)-threonylcarbamoyltransferase complex ATPase subunit type 1 TsaE [Desulfitobacteriaceae bacterium]MDD4753634.1 tRNA (adenosine(37)-N6)-threonylcarbamoyltransferase complex ATPase subunit type 1 TsaE [Desulfitobacteriaceae bacterium]